MKQINLSNALEQIFSQQDSGIICGGDSTIRKAIRQCDNTAASEMTCSAYESDGCIIIEDKYDSTLIYVVCPASNLPDYLAAANKVKKDDYEIDLCVSGSLTPELDQLWGWLNFGRHGDQITDSPFKCSIDGVAIRRLELGDKDALTSFCKVPDESRYAADIYDTFLYFADRFAASDNLPVLLGAWDGGKLLGVVSVNHYELGRFHRPIARIEEIVVHPDFRRRGIGRVLCKAALSVYPNSWYFYTCHKRNENSAATARSAGFTLVGAMLCMD